MLPKMDPSKEALFFGKDMLETTNVSLSFNKAKTGSLNANKEAFIWPLKVMLTEPNFTSLQKRTILNKDSESIKKKMKKTTSFTHSVEKLLTLQVPERKTVLKSFNGNSTEARTNFGTSTILKRSLHLHQKWIDWIIRILYF